MRPVPIQPSFTSLIGVGNREFLCGIERNDLGALRRKYHFFLDARCRDAVGGRAVGLDREHHAGLQLDRLAQRDRKSTRLNSSHGYISYAVFCLKKKKKD